MTILQKRMVDLYVKLIKSGLKKLEDVPINLRAAVEEILNASQVESILE